MGADASHGRAPEDNRACLVLQRHPFTCSVCRTRDRCLLSDPPSRVTVRTFLELIWAAASFWPQPNAPPVRLVG